MNTYKLTLLQKVEYEVIISTDSDIEDILFQNQETNYDLLINGLDVNDVEYLNIIEHGSYPKLTLLEKCENEDSGEYVNISNLHKDYINDTNIV